MRSLVVRAINARTARREALFVTQVALSALAIRCGVAVRMQRPARHLVCKRCLRHFLRHLDRCRLLSRLTLAALSHFLLLQLFRFQIIVVVPFEQCLHGRSLQLLLLLDHLVTEGVFPLLICVVSIEVVVFCFWHEWRFNLFVVQFVPVVVFEPGVLFDFFGAVQAQS